jgi:glycosyltransferase involved in cell wall biosynthesis
MGYPSHSLLSSGKLYQRCAADIYHSEEPTIGTYLAQKAMPDRKHIVTSQDPRTTGDWLTEYRYFSLRQKGMFPLMYLYEKNTLVKKAVQNADAVYCQAKHIIPKTQSLYGLSAIPDFLPNPVQVPEEEFAKAKTPTVCFLARWDRRKRPEIFFNLAKKFPHVAFIAVGKAHDKRYDRYLRKKYAAIPNLEMTGFIDQFSSESWKHILGKSWIVINTAARECLPVAFLEAAAFRCALLSGNNPDGFAENFGYHVHDGNYAAGLDFLLGSDRWRERGARGYEYVKKTHELDKVIDQHIDIYTALCGQGS